LNNYFIEQRKPILSTNIDLSTVAIYSDCALVGLATEETFKTAMATWFVGEKHKIFVAEASSYLKRLS